MKHLGSLIAFIAFTLLALGSARAGSLDLERQYFYTDNGTSVSTLEASYEVFGYSSGDNYSVTVDYFFATLDIESVMFEVWFEDDTQSIYLGDSTYGGAIEAGEDFSWLDLSLALPSSTPGTFSVAVTFYFGDGTQLTDWLSTPVY